MKLFFYIYINIIKLLILCGLLMFDEKRTILCVDTNVNFDYVSNEYFAL